MITLLIRMAICENTVTFSLTLLRDLLIFENWRGGANGIRGGGIAPPPPAPPLATALDYKPEQFALLSYCSVEFKLDFLVKSHQLLYALNVMINGKNWNIFVNVLQPHYFPNT